MMIAENEKVHFPIDPNFQTPVAVCKYMVSLIPKKTNTVLEPTPGEGNLVNELVKLQKFQITAAGDFFLINKAERFDCIVMNPPFSSKSAFMLNAPEGVEVHGMKLGYYILKQCMEMSNNVIALMPWFTISDSDVRLRFLKAYGLKSLTALPRKTFQYARIQTVVIELERGYQNETIFKTLNF